MIYVRMAGGLANQIYQYMGAYSLSRKLGQKLTLDISMCTNGFTRGFLLNCFPEIKYDGLINNTLKYKAGVVDNIDSIKDEFAEGKCVLLKSIDTELKKNRHFRVERYSGLDSSFDESVEDYYLCGNWLDKAYWGDYIDELRGVFFAPEGIDDYIDKFKKNDIYNSVGIHIRRGDFVYNGLTESDDADFFKASIIYLKKLNSQFEFYVFSDEMEYAIDVLGGENKNVHFISSMEGLYGDVIDFCCLSLCRIKVFSKRSTYSKLAFDLNPDKDKKYLVKNKEDSGLKHSIRNTSARYFKSFNCININQKEIEEFSVSYKTSMIPYKKEPDQVIDRSIDICKKLFNDGELEKAEQIAHKIWIKYDADMLFHELYGNILYGLGKNKEAAIEYSRVGMYNTFSHEDIKDQIEFYREIRKRCYYIYPDRIIHGVMAINGMLLIGVILRRLGHKVVFLFDHDDYYNLYLGKKNELIDQDGTEYGCEVISANTMDSDGLKRLVQNNLKSDYKDVLICKDNPSIDEIEYYKLREKDFELCAEIKEVYSYGMRDVFKIEDVYFDTINRLFRETGI